MSAAIINLSRTWTSGDTLGEARRMRLSAYGVTRDAADLEALDAREFERMMDRARQEWHVSEAKRAALRLGSSATSIEEIAPSLAVIP